MHVDIFLHPTATGSAHSSDCGPQDQVSWVQEYLLKILADAVLATVAA